MGHVRCRRLFGLALLPCVAFGVRGQKTETEGPDHGPAKTREVLPPPLALQSQEPVTYGVGSPQGEAMGHAVCDADGAVYLPYLEGTGRVGDTSGVSIVGLMAGGDVKRYQLQATAGVRNVVPLFRYFVSSDRVYLTGLVERRDPMDMSKWMQAAPLIQVFEKSGSMVQSIVREPGTAASNLAAFEDGEILLLSGNGADGTTGLTLLDPVGQRESKMQLFDDDFSRGLGVAAKGDALYASKDSQALGSLLALMDVLPHGQNLWMLPSRASLPMVEVSPRGRVHATKLALLPGTAPEHLLASDDGLVHVVTGTFHLLYPDQTASAENPRVFTSGEIDVFRLLDGALVGRVTLPRLSNPVCEWKGEYLLLQTRKSDGRLQVLHARPE